MIVENAVHVYVGEPGRRLSIRLKVVNEGGREIELGESASGLGDRPRTGRRDLELCIRALKLGLAAREQRRNVVMHTELQYVLENYRKAMFEWPNTGWKHRSSERPIENADLWKELLKMMKKADNERIRITWLHGL